jgi:hypothetical protein
MTNWNPDDPALKAAAPHEVAGILRWHKAKVPSQEIMKLLHIRGTQLIKQIELAMHVENTAHEKGIPVHDALITKEISE